MAAKITAICLALLVLAGCSASTAEDMFRMPELPKEFVEFNDQLNAIRAKGGEFTAPVGGFNRQAVQLMDLDNDGIDEGIAFFKALNSSRVSVYVFKKLDDNYHQLALIEGAGNIVERVSYSDLVGDGNFALVIGWGLEDSSAKTLTAYEISYDGMKKLVETPYLYYAEADMNSDGVTDLNVVMPNEKDSELQLAFYTRGMGEFRLGSAAPLSRDISAIKKIRTGSALDGATGIFIDSVSRDKSTLTDLIIFENGRLRNVTLNPETHVSDSTRRSFSVYCEDADGDGIIEIPSTHMLPGYEAMQLSEALYGIMWRKYTEKGALEDSAFSYHEYVDNWHIIMPVKWMGRITAERMSQDKGVMFYGVDERGKKKHLFSIYALTGESRHARAAYSGRFRLLEKQSVIYVASIKQDSYLGVKITQDSLKEMFRWRETEWSSSQVVA